MYVCHDGNGKEWKCSKNRRQEGDAAIRLRLFSDWPRSKSFEKFRLRPNKRLLFPNSDRSARNTQSGHGLHTQVCCYLYTWNTGRGSVRFGSVRFGSVCAAVGLSDCRQRQNWNCVRINVTNWIISVLNVILKYLHTSWTCPNRQTNDWTYSWLTN